MCSENQKRSRPIVDDDYQNQPRRPEPLEDYFIHATEKQLIFIERLRQALNYSWQTCDHQISNIIKRPVPIDGMWCLSRSEASQIIDKFKEWKEKMK